MCIYLDYERRVGGFGPTVEVTGDVDADLTTIRDFVGGVRGQHPEMAGTVAFRPRDVADEPD